MGQIVGYFVAGMDLPAQGFVADWAAVVGAGVLHKKVVEVGCWDDFAKKSVVLDDDATARHWVWGDCVVPGIFDSPLLNLLV